MDTSLTRALIAANADAFDAYLVDENVEYPLTASDRAALRITLNLATSREHLAAANAIRSAGIPKASADPRAEPDPALALNRSDITIRPRVAYPDAITAWEAQFDGRLPSGERIVMMADGMVPKDARSNLERMIEKEGWWIRG